MGMSWPAVARVPARAADGVAEAVAGAAAAGWSAAGPASGPDAGGDAGGGSTYGPHSLAPDTPALSEAAASPRNPGAACTIGTASAAPEPLAQPMARSSSGRR